MDDSRSCRQNTICERIATTQTAPSRQLILSIQTPPRPTLAPLARYLAAGDSSRIGLSSGARRGHRASVSRVVNFLCSPPDSMQMASGFVARLTCDGAALKKNPVKPAGETKEESGGSNQIKYQHLARSEREGRGPLFNFLLVLHPGPFKRSDILCDASGTRHN